MAQITNVEYLASEWIRPWTCVCKRTLIPFPSLANEFYLQFTSQSTACFITGSVKVQQGQCCFKKRCMLFSEFATSASWWSPISAYSGYKFWNVHYPSVILNPKSQQQFNYNGLNTCKMTFSLRNRTQKIRKKPCKVILHDIFSKAIALKYSYRFRGPWGFWRHIWLFCHFFIQSSMTFIFTKIKFSTQARISI